MWSLILALLLVGDHLVGGQEIMSWRLIALAHIWPCVLGSIRCQVPLKSDDGESGAGLVILRMLERAERQNELIIFTRWYGGKHLGGDRFRHVQNATRMYLER